MTTRPTTQEEEAAEEIPYASPTVPRDAFFAEHFDDPAAFEKRWVRSQAKKDGADEELNKYDGTRVTLNSSQGLSFCSIPRDAVF